MLMWHLLTYKYLNSMFLRRLSFIYLHISCEKFASEHKWCATTIHRVGCKGNICISLHLCKTASSGCVGWCTHPYKVIKLCAKCHQLWGYYKFPSVLMDSFLWYLLFRFHKRRLENTQKYTCLSQKASCKVCLQFNVESFEFESIKRTQNAAAPQNRATILFLS